MKKSSFVAMILGTTSMFLFALGLCMTLILEWNTFQPGIVLGCVGLLLGIITLIVWRKMEHKKPIHISLKTVFISIIIIIDALGLGLGMCFSMVWNKIIVGIIIGFIGIIILLCLIPLAKGINH